MSAARRKAARAFALERDLSHFVPIAKRQARKAGRQGISVENVKRVAGNIQPAHGDRAYLSLLWSSVMMRAGLRRIAGRYVRTQRIKKKGGNLVAVWRAA